MTIAFFFQSTLVNLYICCTVMKIYSLLRPPLSLCTHDSNGIVHYKITGRIILRTQTRTFCIANTHGWVYNRTDNVRTSTTEHRTTTIQKNFPSNCVLSVHRHCFLLVGVGQATMIKKFHAYKRIESGYTALIDHLVN